MIPIRVTFGPVEVALLERAVEAAEVQAAAVDRLVDGGEAPAVQVDFILGPVGEQ